MGWSFLGSYISHSGHHSHFHGSTNHGCHCEQERVSSSERWRLPFGSPCLGNHNCHLFNFWSTLVCSRFVNWYIHLIQISFSYSNFIATVLSINHLQSLKKESESSAPGEKPQFLGIREQRVTNILIGICIGLSTLITPILALIPMPVLFGVFLFMGVSSLKGLQVVIQAVLPIRNQDKIGRVGNTEWAVGLFSVCWTTPITIYSKKVPTRLCLFEVRSSSSNSSVYVHPIGNSGHIMDNQKSSNYLHCFPR